MTESCKTSASESNVKEPIGLELQRIEEDCIHSGKAQFNAGDRWARYHYWLGIPSAVFSALAGAAFLKNHVDIAAGLSTFAAVLTALMTFLKPSERASKHKSAGDQYLSLRNDARVFREIKLQHACDEQSAIDGLDEFTKRRNELNSASPLFSRRDYETARDGITKGEAAHKVDKEE